MRRAAASFAAACCLLCGPAWGWGNQGHELINRAAARALGEEVPDWLRAAEERLAYLGPEPDRWRVRELETLDRGAAPDHYIDLEWARGIDPKTPPPTRHEFARIVARNLRRSPDNVGYAPYRAIELCQRLEAHIASLALVDGDGPAATARRRQARENVLFTAGILGHYVADLSNPHHCSIHFNGWKGPNPKGYPTDAGTHWRFESAFVERVLDRLEVRVSAPVRTDLDYGRAVWDLVVESNGKIEELYALDRDGAFAPGGEERPEGRRGVAFVVERMNRAATLLRDLWSTACARGTLRGRSEALRLRIKEALRAAGLDLRVAVRLDGHVRVWGEIHSAEEGRRARAIVAACEGVASSEFRLRALY
ncbi:MAG: hypothetical protein D6731_15395 [Planctomycetota bacterium]|nr:MAG: hypothetical protein D6731_15395 [Planctomycetota bacterium]